MRRTLAAASRNLISQLGTVVALVSGVLIATLIAVQLIAAEGHPYLGIITYMILPGFFVTGLALIVLGVLRARRRVSTELVFPVIDFNLERTRRRIVTFLVLLSVCVIAFAAGTTKAVEFMESNVFCGAVCHTVMSPEYTAFQDSPHANLHCVECHVGPGTGRFLGAKLNGAGQMLAVLTNSFDRPVPTPVHHLPPADVTCTACHWPGRFHGTVPRVITRYASDEANTETRTVLQLKVGGGGYGFRKSHGIHWHNDPGVTIRYRADETRTQMHEVELTLADGTVKRYAAKGTEDDGTSEWRTMSCIDCHNRPAHQYHEAADAVDLAIERGTIDRSLPWIRREAERAVRVPYDSHDSARRGIAEDIAAFYRAEIPDVATERAKQIEAAGRVLGDIYARNVYPTMNIDWGTYPDHRGHRNSAGCYRCHSGNHVTETGEMITVDCRACHEIVAWADASPQLRDLVEEPVVPEGRAP